MKFAVSSVKCQVHTKHTVISSVQCAVCSIQSAVFSIQYAVFKRTVTDYSEQC